MGLEKKKMLVAVILIIELSRCSLKVTKSKEKVFGNRFNMNGSYDGLLRHLISKDHNIVPKIGAFNSDSIDFIMPLWGNGYVTSKEKIPGLSRILFIVDLGSLLDWISNTSISG